MEAELAPARATASAGVGVAAEPTPASRTVTPPATKASLRSWLAIDERRALAAFAATRVGRACLVLTFGALLAAAFEPRTALLVLVAAAFAAYRKAHLEYTLLAATTLALLLNPAWYSGAELEGILAQASAGTGLSGRHWLRLLGLAYLVLSWALLRWTAAHPQALLTKRPLVCSLSALAAGCALAWSLQQAWPDSAVSTSASAWLMVATKLAGSYLWFMCYGIVDQRSAKRPSALSSLATFHPFWGSSSAPIGKGAMYQAKLRCRSDAELAVTQLKAVKLLAWSFVLLGLSRGLQALAAHFAIPRFEQLLESFLHGENTSVLKGWCALLIAVAVGTLELAVWGHQIVAGARFAGFKLRRNTFRPLESRTLADFWNRYYFYFKELLVDFFFYPTFLRWQTRRPKLRVFLATFMAAGVGNAIYHFVRDIELVYTLGPSAAFGSYLSYLFYCSVLAIGIGVSQARAGDGGQTRHAPEPSLVGRAWSLLCVWGFVVCLHPFGGFESRAYSLSERLSFMAHQLGASR